MDTFSFTGLGLLALCLVLAMFVAAVEAGLITISRARVRSMAGQGVPRAEILQSYVQDPSSLLGALGLARNLALVAGAALAVAIVTREQGHHWEWIALIVLGALVLFALLEAVPRNLVSKNPERWGLRLAPFMGILKLVFGGAGRVISLPSRVTTQASPEEEEDILRFLEIEESKGEIEDDERKMLRAVIDFENTAVREIMTPRTDFVAVDIETSLDEVVRLIMDRGFSRIPLYEKNVDAIAGIIYAKDLFRYLRESRQPRDLKEIARRAVFVPESKHLDDLLTDMRKQRVHMAIVVDEYGGTAGLVTIEDLLEEIVGEIEDEYDRVEHPIVTVSDDEALLDGRVSIWELNELLDAHIEAEDFDTVGGCVFHMLGRVPVAGDIVEPDGVVLTVLSVDGHRVRRVRAVRRENRREEAGSGNGRHQERLHDS